MTAPFNTNLDPNNSLNSTFNSSSLSTFAPPLNFPASPDGSVSAKPNSNTAGTPGGSNPNVSNSFKVRISPLNPAIFYGGSSSPMAASQGITNTGGSSTMSSGQVSTANNGASLLSPIQATNGVIFPYSPNINFEQSVEYTQTDMIQTNLTYEVYRKTPSVNITITGKFTVQNQTEGQYAIGVIHFFRVASKMYFGTLAGTNAGLPPPILVLNGYGTYMFNNLNCILKSHNWAYEENVDTVTINIASGGNVRLPSLFTLTVSLTVQQTPQQMRSQFNLDAFRTGQLMQGGGWI